MDDALSQIRKLLADRHALYIKKRERYDALADDTCTEYEKVTHTIEAFEWLGAEVDRAIADSGSDVVALLNRGEG